MLFEFVHESKLSYRLPPNRMNMKVNRFTKILIEHFKITDIPLLNSLP